MKKTIKKIFTGLLCVVLCGSMLCGCSTQRQPNNAKNDSEDNFVISEHQFERIVKLSGVDVAGNGIVLNGPNFTYYRCKLTDVIYVSFSSDGGAYDSTTGFTVMVKADGTPMLYDEWIELLKTNEAAPQD